MQGLGAAATCSSGGMIGLMGREKERQEADLTSAFPVPQYLNPVPLDQATCYDQSKSTL